MLNIVLFHYKVQRNISDWDTLAKPPAAARTSATISLIAWLCVITMGRFIAYDWFECGKAIPHWVNVVEECAVSEHGALDLKGIVK
jgi:hypothetical protein